MSKAQQSYGREQVVQIINSVVSKIENVGGDATTTGIFKELKSLQRVIEEARADIGSTRPTDIKEKHIPIATDELDAVVESTAEATGTIMDCCDVIQEKAAETGGEAADTINNEIIKIYEACSFQDITGQRITKVVATLKTIEEKVGKLIEILSHRLPIEEGEATDGDEGKTIEERLLNGPQMPDKAITQDDIDKLLEDF
ncbi:MAG TPA: protein phosphatase CheZ [Alphaproteobacteria bacterium]|nr:protein phosphatase CheZ [Alphaproteobacteria bacterium]USO06632.1 MAG: protein phosphatase CheZ [Rhodospirillales bacterium]HOO82085.1 protein phosphatase CheZ [Alphaproteobacteria bacterium]